MGADYRKRTVVVNWKLLPLFTQRKTRVFCIRVSDNNSLILLLCFSVDQTSYEEKRLEKGELELGTRSKEARKVLMDSVEPAWRYCAGFPEGHGSLVRVADVAAVVV